MSTPEWVPKMEQSIVGGPTIGAQNGAGATIGAQVSVRLKFAPNELGPPTSWPAHKVARPQGGAAPTVLAQNSTIIKSSTNCESSTSSRTSASLPHAASLHRRQALLAQQNALTRPLHFVSGRGGAYTPCLTTITSNQLEKHHGSQLFQQHCVQVR